MDDLTLKPCSKTLWTSMDVQNLTSNRDRISSLPNELISRILGFLPTKDAAAWSVCSKKLRLHFTCWLTSLDFDDSPISHCLDCPYLIESFPTFKKFVDSVLQACQSIEHLTRFKLRFGGDKRRMYENMYENDSRLHTCLESCYPYLDPLDLYAWMCFPLIRQVKELDLCINVKEPGIYLPLEIFTCKTLEVLKLDVGLDIDDDDDDYRVSFCLPNLKLLHLRSVLFCNDDFVTRLVSSCPSLEDLALDHCCFTLWDFITISSPSLQRLVLDMSCKRDKGETDGKNSEVLVLDTPNLLYFRHVDNLAMQYSFTAMNALVSAEIDIHRVCQTYNYEDASFKSILSLVRTLSSVQRLSLMGAAMESLDFGELKNQLPMFLNLSCLELGCYENTWDKLLLEFLNCSPFLETLTFQEGLNTSPFEFSDRQLVELEARCWETTQVIPPCCKSCLKRIVIQRYRNNERELNLVKFLLRNASVLEELVIICETYEVVDQMSLASTLKKLPRASITCSIRVQ